MKNYKNILAILTVVFSLFTSANAQVAIGKESVTNSSVSLEFGAQNRGIILPWVTSAASVKGSVNGTLIYDIAAKAVKVKQGGVWVPYTTLNAGAVNSSLQNGLTENTSAKVSIGSTVSNVPGILVLEDNNKAMILPKVASPHLNIINPEPGTIAFDTVKQQVAVFNGKYWEFWN